MNISLYVQGGDHRAVTYYRFTQYFREFNISVKYRLMIPDSKATVFLPISKQGFIKKVFIFCYIFIRVQVMLIQDLIVNPDYLVISRKLIHRVFPISYQWCLKRIKKKGTKIIWDFDDQIIHLKEVSAKGFLTLSQVSDTIIVGSPLLENLVKEEYRYKVAYFPTTDGDMYQLFSERVLENRLSYFPKEIRLVWVGTFSGLRFLYQILPSFELLGEKGKKSGRITRLSVVCDYPLEYEPVNFVLENIKWERDVAVQIMLNAHLGLMPLEDTEETRGKCGFKLIQYMSIGLPIIASKVGINAMIIKDSFGCAVPGVECEEWARAIFKLVSDKDDWREYCLNSINEWKKNYSYEGNLKMWRKLLNVV